MSATPYVTSRTNGIKIPLIPGQAGIMHRFQTPENQLLMAEVNPGSDASTETDRLQLPATPDPAVEELKATNAAQAEQLANQADALVALQKQVQELLSAKTPAANPPPVIDPLASAVASSATAVAALEAEKPPVRPSKQKASAPPAMPGGSATADAVSL